MYRKDGRIEKGLKGGWIKGVAVEKIGGLTLVTKRVDIMYEGVSRRRLVVEPWKP